MRGKPAPKRKINPDPKYQSVTMAKFVNHLMRRGKKTAAQKIAYSSLERLAGEQGQDPVTVLEQVVQTLGPTVEVRSKRVGGANYQIPVPVRQERRLFLAFRWLIGAASHKKGAAMNERLYQEMKAALKGEGDAMKKKQDVHRMAEANRAFAHFA